MSRFRPVVGASEAITLLFIFISSKVFLTYTVFYYHKGLNASWVIPLITTIAGVVVALLLVALLNRYPGLDLVEIGEELAGPYLNLLFAFFYLALLLLGAGMALRGTSEGVVSGFLTDTPISLVIAFFITGTMVVSYLGLEAVARTARFFVSVLVVTALVLVALTIPLWHWDAFFPLLGPGPLKLLLGSLNFTGDFVQIILLGLICHFLPAGRIRAIGVGGTLIAGFFLFLFTTVPILVYDYPPVTELMLPSFELARIINMGRFGQRMEVLFVPLWVFGNMIFLSISYYAAAVVLTRICKLRDYRPFVLAATVLTAVIAFIPQNVIQAAYWSQLYLGRYSLGMLVAIILLLLLISIFRGKGGGLDEKSN
ncbi:GerAB/ArcD/ProY family transporter [Desulfotruncus alcoholivorax]|uniref:GerAB/ArcD/ProY family transporter n=1 Tax=Desulfotruncus alcoholivorax TaxID=265477 RepID=UPI0003FC3548|nr:GerAB/ArcD/ProY family transporter [Desulfotruncus alcoholivorax]